MKIWVDDFRDAPDDTWNVARTTEDAIRIIAMMGSHIREISLDHDIENRPETFQPVAYFIGVKWKGKTHTHPKVTIHSISTLRMSRLGISRTSMKRTSTTSCSMVI